MTETAEAEGVLDGRLRLLVVVCSVIALESMPVDLDYVNGFLTEPILLLNALALPLPAARLLTARWPECHQNITSGIVTIMDNDPAINR